MTARDRGHAAVVPTNGRRPVSRVVGEIVHGVNALARAEARLAVAELENRVTAKASGAAKAGAVIVGGGVLGVLALAGLMLAATAALALYLATWLAALVVTVMVGVIAYAVVTAGISSLRRSLKPSIAAIHAKENM